MKIQGPGGPPRTPATTSVGGTERADASTGVDRTRETQPVSAVNPITHTDPIAELAAAVRAGTLTPKQAVDRLVESAMATMGAGLPEAARLEVRSRLEALLVEDPYLADKTRRIGVVTDEE